MAKEYTSEMVIATLYEGAIVNEKFSKEFKTAKSGAKPVKRSWAKLFNEKAEGSGKWYEFDEDATIDFYVLVKEAAAERKDAEEFESGANIIIKDVVNSIKKKKKTKE